MCACVRGLYLELQLFCIGFSALLLFLFQLLFIPPLFSVLAWYYPPDRSSEGADEVLLLLFGPPAVKHDEVKGLSAVLLIPLSLRGKSRRGEAR